MDHFQNQPQTNGINISAAELNLLSFVQSRGAITLVDVLQEMHDNTAYHLEKGLDIDQNSRVALYHTNCFIQKLKSLA